MNTGSWPAKGTAFVLRVMVRLVVLHIKHGILFFVALSPLFAFDVLLFKTKKLCLLSALFYDCYLANITRGRNVRILFGTSFS